MTTDTKAVARFDLWGFDGFMEPQKKGEFVRFTDHERIVEEIGLLWARELVKRDDALAASRAQVEGLKKDAERYRWLREDYDPSIHDDGFEPLFSLGPDNLDAEIDAMIDAAMEKGNV